MQRRSNYIFVLTKLHFARCTRLIKRDLYHRGVYQTPYRYLLNNLQFPFDLPSQTWVRFCRDVRQIMLTGSKLYNISRANKILQIVLKWQGFHNLLKSYEKPRLPFFSSNFAIRIKLSNLIFIQNVYVVLLPNSKFLAI